VDNHRRFQTLAEDYITLCEQITLREPQAPAEKKTPAARG
jgi:hypothetical protein